MDDDQSIHLEVEPLRGSTNSEVKVESQERNSANTQPYLQDYLLAKDRERRTSNPPNRFGYADMVAFALNIA